MKDRQWECPTLDDLPFHSQQCCSRRLMSVYYCTAEASNGRQPRHYIISDNSSAAKLPNAAGASSSRDFNADDATSLESLRYPFTENWEELEDCENHHDPIKA